MNRLEHILTITAEECNEVAQRITKSLRFGLLNIEEGQEDTNLARILEEYTDLVTMLEMLETELKNSNDENLKSQTLNLREIHRKNYIKKQGKMNRVEEYLKISKREGTLD